MVAMHCVFGLSYCLMIWGYPIAALITLYPFHIRANTFRHADKILKKGNPFQSEDFSLKCYQKIPENTARSSGSTHNVV